MPRNLKESHFVISHHLISSESRIWVELAWAVLLDVDCGTILVFCRQCLADGLEDPRWLRVPGILVGTAGRLGVTLPSPSLRNLRASSHGFFTRVVGLITWVRAPRVSISRDRKWNSQFSVARAQKLAQHHFCYSLLVKVITKPIQI